MGNAVDSDVVAKLVQNDAEVPCFRSGKVSTVTELSLCYKISCGRAVSRPLMYPHENRA